MAEATPSCATSTTTSLVERLAEAKQELFNLRFQHVTGQLDNYARLRRRRAGHRPHPHRAAGPRDRRGRGAGRDEETQPDG